MKYFMFLFLALTACDNQIAHVGDYRLIQCGHISGCDVERVFKTKENCEEVKKTLNNGIFGYTCEEVK